MEEVLQVTELVEVVPQTTQVREPNMEVMQLQEWSIFIYMPRTRLG
jgi:hypothetical protein